MATLSSLFERLQAEQTFEEDLFVRVVIEPQHATTASGMQNSNNQPLSAKAALCHAGVASTTLTGIPDETRRLFVRDTNILLSLPLTAVRHLAADSAVRSIRPARMHSISMDVSSAGIGIINPSESRYNGDGVLVAVLDSGIDVDHPDFAGRIDFQRSRNFSDVGADTDITDENGHGTHVAGIIGGAGPVYRGVAPGVRFMICKVFGKDGRGDEGAVTEAVQWAVSKGADVINYSGGWAPVFSGFPAVKPPWVWPQSEMEEERAFREAASHGVLSVVAAGNHGNFGAGTISVPATEPNVLAVGAVIRATEPGNPLSPSSFTSLGPVYRSPSVNSIDTVDSLEHIDNAKKYNCPQLAAPGGELSGFLAALGGCIYDQGIVSCRSRHIAMPAATPQDPCQVTQRYVKMSGTSQSAPHITGMAARILQAIRPLEERRDQRHVSRDQLRVKLVRRIILGSCGNPLPKARKTAVGAGVPNWPAIEATLNDLLNGTKSPRQLAR